MFENLVLIIQICMLITLYITLPTLFIYRLFMVIKLKKDLVKSLLIVLLPFSLGVYLFYEDSNKHKVYNILLIILFSISILGISFTLFQVLISRYDFF